MTGVRRRIDTDKIKRNKIRVPACIERIGSPTYRGQVEKYYKDLIMRREHYKAHEFLKRFQSNPNAHVPAWRSFKTHQFKELATTGWYSKGKTDPRYLEMDG